MARKMQVRRYGKPGAQTQIAFLESKAWRRAMDPKEIKEVNRQAVSTAANDFQKNRLILRFDGAFMSKAPFFVRATERILFSRARKSYKEREPQPGAPDLRPMFARRFGGWDPWSDAQPPLDQVRKRNAVLLKLNVGGYKTSALDRWRRASADYRRWAKALTHDWLRQQVGQYAPLTYQGVLRRGISSGKIKTSVTSKKAVAEIPIPRNGRQNRAVIRVFGGGGRQAIATSYEIKRWFSVMAQTIAALVTGKASAVKAKRGRKRK